MCKAQRSLAAHTYVHTRSFRALPLSLALLQVNRATPLLPIHACRCSTPPIITTVCAARRRRHWPPRKRTLCARVDWRALARTYGSCGARRRPVISLSLPAGSGVEGAFGAHRTHLNL
uniref:Uncharacterized protein n=1 Tax=Hordeum vulgare subsp. vulgare TaxID=112509 RepID=A0A8I6XJ11_HORVV